MRKASSIILNKKDNEYMFWTRCGVRQMKCAVEKKAKIHYNI